MFYWLLLGVAILQIYPTSAINRSNKYVTTLINAKWQDTPFVLEVAEYLSDEDPNYFWKFVDEVTSKHADFQNSTKSKHHYDLILPIAEKFLSPAETNVLKLGLSLRIYSARVEMFSKMAENKNHNLECANFVDVGGHFTCSLQEIDQLIYRDNWNQIDTYSIDHFYLGKKNSNKTIVLYGLMGSEDFLNFHNKLKDISEIQNVNYLLRHYIQERESRKLRLSGYGVELQMKSTEYKATDDSDIKENSDDTNETPQEINEGFDETDGINFALLKKLHPEKIEKLDEFQNYLLKNSQEISALKVWQFQDLSQQAAQRIMKAPAEEAIQVLTDIAQNFPMQTKSLINTKVNPEMRKEIKQNQEIFSTTLNIQPSDTALFVNGLFFDLDVVDILTLLESLRSELRVMESLHKIGFGSQKASKLLALDLTNNADKQEFALDIRDSAIIWVNDIEHDYRYSRWPTSLNEMLRPTFPGMLRNLRRNLYNLVLIIDPLQDESTPLINLAESLFIHSAPLRVGFILITNFDTNVNGAKDPSVAVNNAFHYFMENKSPKDAIQFLSSLENYIKPEGVDVNDIRKAIRAKDSNADVGYIIGEESEFDVGRHLAHDFVKRTGFKKFPQALLNGIPLPSDQLTADSFEEAVLTTIMAQTPMVQKAIYRGELKDADDIVDYLMNQPNVMPRLNERILNTEKSTWVNLFGSIPTEKDYKKWSAQDTSTWLMDKLHYLYIERKSVKYHMYTLWVVVDLNKPESRQLLKETIEYLETNPGSRAAIIINSDGFKEPLEYDINVLALSAINSLPVNKSFHFIKNLIKEEAWLLLENNSFTIEEPEIKENLGKEKSSIDIHRYYSKFILNLNNLQRAVLCNGRIIGPLDTDEEFTSDDFSLLERLSESIYGDKLFKYLIKSHYFENEDENFITDDIIMKITSLLVSRPQTKSRFDVPFSSDVNSVVKIPAINPDAVAFSLVAVVDPVSRGAQKLGPILNVLRKSLNCEIKIFLNCIEKNSDMPLKSFYRFVFESEPQFNTDGDLIGASAKFTKLPTSSLLTQNIHPPENWLVEVVKSVYDLDNIKLDNVAIGVHSDYELEYLLLEGHCFEAHIGNPPRGLQITLGMEKQPVMVDTIVMANLGYFQLKANPGEWLLRLREGRSTELYDISSVNGVDVIHHGNDVKVLVSSLKSNVLKLKVSKKPDKAGMDLLSDDDDENSGIWNSISRTFSNSEGEDEQDMKINVFSLASGHLYERFLRIMMLSVIKHTKIPVKFWFLKNYLSPTFKDFLPHMAEEYGFEYELVQYKWPRWLHQQTEKQRIIWGYKILFLDVLFPLSVKKIIYIDADQVVRADLKELVEMDLRGAPYAYTPFCDSRQEMDGFRFWKHGYWKNHLQARPYHISALYVVDLKRFRRVAAGDRLRGQYQALSQDPNSLSNLDQDLPNNMIHSVAIKSLPQEWLWCETWCDDESKKRAKTIDLCNNPMTKEAKLQAAMRILPEWVGYDEEIKVLQHKIEHEGRHIEKVEEVSSETQQKHEEL